MKVVCVYKSGGDYDVRYVRALKACLTKFSPEPFDFYCLTDISYETESFTRTVELRHNWPGWWSKLELFNPEHSFNKRKGTVLYFDLDVIILKDLSHLIELCRHLTWPMSLRSSDVVGEAKDWPSSSIMAWQGDMMKEVYYQALNKGIYQVQKEAIEKTSRAGQRTDQGFIRTIIDPNKLQDFLPENYIAFKHPHWMQNPKVIETATILNWTGKPRFSDMKKSTIKTIWKNNYSSHKINQIL
jgi:hypothetical protein